METQETSLIATLMERNKNYGSFLAQSTLSESIKRIFRATPSWEKMQPDQREALEHIAVKVSRILNGNPDHFDSWHDVGGYSKLVADRLAK